MTQNPQDTSLNSTEEDEKTKDHQQDQQRQQQQNDQPSTSKKDNDIDLTDSKPSQEDQEKNDINSSQKTVQRQERIFEGILRDHGDAKHNYEGHEIDSYYVKVDNGNTETTVWGPYLSEVMDTDVKIGDDIKLKFMNEQDVRILLPGRDDAGEIITHMWQHTHYDACDVKKLDLDKVQEELLDKLRKETAAAYFGRIENPQHREILKGAVEHRLSARQKVGNISHDKTAHSKESEQGQTTLDPQHHLEHTR